MESLFSSMTLCNSSKALSLSFQFVLPIFVIKVSDSLGAACVCLLGVAAEALLAVFLRIVADSFALGGDLSLAVAWGSIPWPRSFETPALMFATRVGFTSFMRSLNSSPLCAIVAAMRAVVDARMLALLFDRPPTGKFSF